MRGWIARRPFHRSARAAATAVAAGFDHRVGLRLYTNAVMVAGAVLLALGMPQSMLVDPRWFVGLVILSIGGSLCKIIRGIGSIQAITNRATHLMS